MKEKVNTILKVLIKQLLKIFYVFPLRDKTIYLLSFQGKSDYGFDGKALVEYSNKNNLGYQFIWAYKGKKPKSTPSNVRYVKINSLQGFYYVLTCKIFITNINPYPYIPYRHKQIIINTWHGYPFKKCGKYIPNFDEKQFNLSSYFLSHADFYSKILIRDSFEYKGKILNIGTPRNDIMFDKEARNKISEYIKKIYSIPKNSKIIMYAPTFRNDYETSIIHLDLNIIKTEIEKKFLCECTLVYRLHPLISENKKEIFENGIDASLYPDMQDLLCAADFLISDYSSCIWDYGLTHKPVFIYAEDYKAYEKERGFYCPLEETPFPVSQNEQELCKTIQKFDYDVYLKNVDNYYKEIGTFENGKCCENLYEYLLNEKVN